MSGKTRPPKPFFYRTVVNVQPLAPGASCPEEVFIHSVMFWHKIHFTRFRKQSLPFALKLDTIYDPPWWMPGYLQCRVCDPPFNPNLHPPIALKTVHHASWTAYSYEDAFALRECSNPNLEQCVWDIQIPLFYSKIRAVFQIT